MVRLIAVSALVLALAGCATPVVGMHDYTISVVNQSGKPVEGVAVSGKSLDRAYRKQTLNRLECKTSKEGLCVFHLEATLGDFVDDAGYLKQIFDGTAERYNGSDWKWGLASAVSINAEHADYFSSPDNRYIGEYRMERTDSSQPPAVPVPTMKIRIVPLKDLLCGKNTGAKVVETADRNIEATLKNIGTQASAKGYHIENFRVAAYKDRDYLSLDIVYPVVFNSEKNTRYENVREVIDRAVRGVAGAMDENLGDWCVGGYKIAVYAERRSFYKEAPKVDDPSKESLALEVYMPKDIVHQYKNDEITGQSLINSSVVLLNGERIDVKMQ
jgi:hypothetical protein